MRTIEQFELDITLALEEVQTEQEAVEVLMPLLSEAVDEGIFDTMPEITIDTTGDKLCIMAKA